MTTLLPAHLQTQLRRQPNPDSPPNLIVRQIWLSLSNTPPTSRETSVACGQLFTHLAGHPCSPVDQLGRLHMAIEDRGCRCCSCVHVQRNSLCTTWQSHQATEKALKARYFCIFYIYSASIFQSINVLKTSYKTSIYIQGCMRGRRKRNHSGT